MAKTAGGVRSKNSSRGRVTDYHRGGDRGGIFMNGEKSYIATTASSSKTFKTHNGAGRWLESFGYKRGKARR